MSLGYGLAKTILKYLGAKKKNGLKSLFLGKVELAEPGNCIKIDKDKVSLGNFAACFGSSNGGSGSGTAMGYKIKCPVCTGNLAFEEGCVKCYKCGFSQC